MSQYFKIHPENPQGRLIRQAADMLRSGHVIIHPTDSGYALGCHLGDKAALNRIIQIRKLNEKHNFTLMCRDLSELSIYSIIDTPAFRLLKANTPGPYTFILRATREVPRRLMHPKQKTIGLRVPDHPVSQALLEEFNEPILTTSMIFPGEEMPVNDAEEIALRLRDQVELVIDSGACGTIPTTMIDLRDIIPIILREGKGDITPFV